MNHRRKANIGAFVAIALAGIAEEASATKLDDAKTNIQHVVIITRETRSFDKHFGAYP